MFCQSGKEDSNATLRESLDPASEDSGGVQSTPLLKAALFDPRHIIVHQPSIVLERVLRWLVPSREWTPRELLEVLGARVAPPACFALLNCQVRTHVFESKRVDEGLERLPQRPCAPDEVDARLIMKTQLLPQCSS